MAYLCWHEYLTLNSVAVSDSSALTEEESKLTACSGWIDGKKKNSVCVKGYQVTDTRRPAAKANLLCVTCYVYRSPTSSVGGVWQKGVKKPRTKKRKESELEAVCIDMYIELIFHIVSEMSQICQSHFHGQCFAFVINENASTATQNNVFHYISSSKHANILISSPSLLKII